jgi:tripartite-type tricarboxylate transporter receptor subunit TctC
MNVTHGIALVLGAAICSLAAGQPYPAKPIRLVVPFAPGQGADVAARVVAQKLSENLRQPIVPDNRPGAGGNIGSEIAAKAPPDGYTLLVGSNGTHAANAALYPNLPFDPQKDFVPISYIGSVAMVLVAAPSFPATGAQDVVAMAKARPGTLNVAIPSSTSRVVLELFKQISGAELFPVNYKGSPTALNDLMGGQIHLSIDTLIATAPHIASGKLKALGVSSARRPAALPAVPTLAESGLAGFDLVAWNVWFAPRGTPVEIVSRLNTETAKVLADADVQLRLRQLGYEPGAGEDPKRVAQFVEGEAQKWGTLIRRAGIKAE